MIIVCSSEFHLLWLVYHGFLNYNDHMTLLQGVQLWHSKIRREITVWVDAWKVLSGYLKTSIWLL